MQRERLFLSCSLLGDVADRNFKEAKKLRWNLIIKNINMSEYCVKKHASKFYNNPKKQTKDSAKVQFSSYAS